MNEHVVVFVAQEDPAFTMKNVLRRTGVGRENRSTGRGGIVVSFLFVAEYIEIREVVVDVVLVPEVDDRGKQNCRSSRR